MTLLKLIAFLGIIAGSFMILEMTPFEFFEAISNKFKGKKKSIKARIKETTNKKKPKGIKLLIEETREILRITGKTEKFSTVCIGSFFLFTMGVIIAVSMNNFFLVPVLSVGFSLIPFWYIKFTANFFKKQLNAELDYLLYEPMKEFITMTILLIGNIPLMYFLNKEWYEILVFTSIGKAILAVCLTVIFISMAAVIKITQPVEYRR